MARSADANTLLLSDPAPNFITVVSLDLSDWPAAAVWAEVRLSNPNNSALFFEAFLDPGDLSAPTLPVGLGTSYSMLGETGSPVGVVKAKVAVLGVVGPQVTCDAKILALRLGASP